MIDLPMFTLIHILISLAGIISGLIVVGGMLSGTRLEGLTSTFLITTLATSVTGFGFPFFEVLPAHVVGALSLVVLAVCLFARYAKGLEGPWRTTFVVTAVTALYFNVFVLIAQLFAKTPALVELGATPEDPAFGITQALVLVLFVGLGRAAVRGFRPRS